MKHLNQTAGKNIWELSCPVKDTILTLCFDWGELLNLCLDCGLRIGNEEGGCPMDWQVFSAAHKACHAPTLTAKRIQRMLELRFKGTVAMFRKFGECTIQRLCQAEHPEEMPDLPGFFWALATDKRPELEAWREYFRQRVGYASQRALLRQTTADYEAKYS